MFPHGVFILGGLASKKIKNMTIGHAADVTTVLLLFSVPLALEALTGMKLGFALFSLLVVIAMYRTYDVWRNEKEIAIGKLLRNIWRIYFIVLSILYVLTLIIGMFYHSTSH